MDLPILKVDTSEQERHVLVADFKLWVKGFLSEINKNPQTKQEFDAAKQVIEQCGDIEGRIKRFEELMLKREGILALREIQKQLASERCALTNKRKEYNKKKKDDLIQVWTVKALSYADELQKSLKYHVNFPRYEFTDTNKKKQASLEKALMASFELYQKSLDDFLYQMAVRTKTFDEVAKDHMFLFPEPGSVIQKMDESTIRTFVDARIKAYEADKPEHKTVVYDPSTVTVEHVDKETGEVIEKPVEMVELDKMKLLSLMEDVGNELTMLGCQSKVLTRVEKLVNYLRKNA